MQGNKWLIIALLAIYAGFGHFNRVGITVAGDEVFIKEMGIETKAMGFVYTIFLIVYTIAMLPGGWLIDRIGSARALTYFGIGMGTFVMLTGTLGWLGLTPTGVLMGLLIIRSFAGFCNAPLHPSAAHVVSNVMPEKQRATANGTITAGALVGIALCYPVFGYLMDKMSWPLAFVVCGAALVGYGVVWKFVAGPALPHEPEKKAAEASDKPGFSQLDLLKQANVWWLTLSYAAYGYFQYLFFYWMGYYFKQILKVPVQDGRIASSLISLAMGAGMLIGGLSADLFCKFLGKNLGRRTIVIMGMGLGGIFGVIGVNCTDFVTIATFLGLGMAFSGMVEGVFWTTATDVGGERHGGFAGGFMNTGGNIGGLIAPVLTPVMADEIGWPNSIAVACVINVIGGGVWLLIRLKETPASDEEELTNVE